MTRSFLVTKHGWNATTNDWTDHDSIRLSWDLPDDTVLEVPTLPDGEALRVSMADLRAMLLQRDSISTKMCSGASVAIGGR
jgi:hypothetical protein